MKQVRFVFVVLAAILLVAGPALAYTLTENFTGATINSSDLTTTTGLNQWNDLVRWQINPTGGNTGAWAQQTPTTTGAAENSLLFYGFNATGLGAGTPFSLSFDFINGVNTFAGSVYVGGLSGIEKISKFAPWPDLSTTWFSKGTLPSSTNIWTGFALNGVVNANDDVLYIAFDMGGTTGLRGIDNVNLYVGAVPEPATLLLLGAGLIGLAGYGRKKFI